MHTYLVLCSCTFMFIYDTVSVCFMFYVLCFMFYVLCFMFYVMSCYGIFHVMSYDMSH